MPVAQSAGPERTTEFHRAGAQPDHAEQLSRRPSQPAVPSLAQLLDRLDAVRPTGLEQELAQAFAEAAPSWLSRELLEAIASGRVPFYYDTNDGRAGRLWSKTAFGVASFSRSELFSPPLPRADDHRPRGHRVTAAPSPIFGPTVITAPGDYVLVNDLEGTGPLLSIAADDVRVNLGGHTLNATSNPAIVAHGVERLKIVDGVLERPDGPLHVIGTGPLLLAEDIRGLSIERLAMLRGGLEIVDSEFVVTTTMIFQALMAAHGIEASGSGVIERCVVSGYVDQAIKIHGEGLRFDRNLVGLSIGGVWVSGSRASITRNVVRAEHTLDLYDDDNLVERNTLSVLSFTGLLVFGHRNHILNNHIQYSASAGLAVRGNDNVLLGNTLQNTRLVLYGSANTYGGNVAWWDPGAMPPPFATPCPGGFSTKNFCEIGAGNVSKGNNYLPDRM